MSWALEPPWLCSPGQEMLRTGVRTFQILGKKDSLPLHPSEWPISEALCFSVLS